MENRLYLVTDRDAAKKRDGREFLRLIGQALEAGVRIVQYREKNSTRRSYESMARAVQILCKGYDALFIVNDDVGLAQRLNSDGIHLGQGDLIKLDRPPRTIISENMILGISVSSVEEAVAAERAGATYVSVGPVFMTATKKDAGEPVGAKRISSIKEVVHIPVVAIGGINQENIGKVITAGADYAAMISGILSQSDIGVVVQKYGHLMSLSVNGHPFKPIERRTYAAALSEAIEQP